MFLQVSVCPQGGGGVRGCSRGGHALLLWGGACVVAPGGACMVAPGGACVVAPRGGMRGCSQGGHAWLLWGGGVRGFFDEIRSISGRYASYWNAFLFQMKWNKTVSKILVFICGKETSNVTQLIKSFDSLIRRFSFNGKTSLKAYTFTQPRCVLKIGPSKDLHRWQVI